MTQRNDLTLAALASAAMPDVAVAGVRTMGPAGQTDARLDIDCAVVQDAAGRLYDVYAADGDAARARLAARVKAASVLAQTREPNGLGFAMDRVLAFVPGGDQQGPTGGTAVMVLQHQEGEPRDLDLLTHDDCMAIGTAIGAIHRLDPSFLTEAGYPAFTTDQIRGQLLAWIANLKQAGHVPPEITASWSRIVTTEGLWSFGTCLVHGGFTNGDVRFAGSTVTAIGNWQDMQINDPARDLGWIFAKLDEAHRNAVLTAYGRMMGNRLDALIMLRANLWVQMEQVGDFIQALSRADSTAIARFKAQVDQLAHRLSVMTPAAARSAAHAPQAAREGDDATNPSTITVGTLLHEGERRRNAQQASATGNTRPAPASASSSADQTADSDRTHSSEVTAPAEADAVATVALAQRPHGAHAPDSDDSTASGQMDATADHTPPSIPVRHAAAPVQVVPHAAGDPVTIAIPLLEREERALRDARAGLNTVSVTEAAADDTHDTGESPIAATPTA